MRLPMVGRRAIVDFWEKAHAKKHKGCPNVSGNPKQNSIGVGQQHQQRQQGKQHQHRDGRKGEKPNPPQFK